MFKAKFCEKGDVFIYNSADHIIYSPFSESAAVDSKEQCGVIIEGTSLVTIFIGLMHNACAREFPIWLKHLDKADRILIGDRG